MEEKTRDSGGLQGGVTSMRQEWILTDNRVVSSRGISPRFFLLWKSEGVGVEMKPPQCLNFNKSTRGKFPFGRHRGRSEYFLMHSIRPSSSPEQFLLSLDSTFKTPASHRSGAAGVVSVGGKSPFGRRLVVDNDGARLFGHGVRSIDVINFKCLDNIKRQWYYKEYSRAVFDRRVIWGEWGLREELDRFAADSLSCQRASKWAGLRIGEECPRILYAKWDRVSDGRRPKQPAFSLLPSKSGPDALFSPIDPAAYGVPVGQLHMWIDTSLRREHSDSCIVVYQSSLTRPGADSDSDSDSQGASNNRCPPTRKCSLPDPQSSGSWQGGADVLRPVFPSPINTINVVRCLRTPSKLFLTNGDLLRRFRQTETEQLGNQRRDRRRVCKNVLSVEIKARYYLTLRGAPRSRYRSTPCHTDAVPVSNIYPCPAPEAVGVGIPVEEEWMACAVYKTVDGVYLRDKLKSMREVVVRAGVRVLQYF
ncbi:hypothetical protein C8R44DRAFT_898394 [Mycena epipterygia]|nr:hypothetical protein C8R44DRAFT_898394 [Mycena epipterygia]